MEMDKMRIINKTITLRKDLNFIIKYRVPFLFTLLINQSITIY